MIDTAVALAPAEWSARAADHATRADALTAGWTARRGAGEKHAIEDFLFTYYGTRPTRLRRWHPGAGIVLRGDAETAAELDDRRAWRWHLSVPDGEGPDSEGPHGVALDTSAFLAERGDTVTYVRELLARTAARPVNLACFGLHEWAMVYRQGGHRHELPLRLGQAGTDAVVEAQQLRCSHFDAFRFFTPDAVPRNTLQPTRETQPDLEQPGCLHANMDLFKWATKLGPAVPGELLLDCFELAMDVRYLDMQASPYDVSGFDLPAVAIETAEGRAEYSRRQRGFAERASVLREHIVAVCDVLLEGADAPGVSAPGIAADVPDPAGARR